MAETDNSDVSGEGSSQASEQEKALALAAQEEFEKSNYSAALQSLNRLEASRPQDMKVLHNKSVVNCYKTGLTNIGQFRKSLSTIARKMQCDLDNPQTLQDVDQCYIFFNEAVSLYHYRQYSKCLNILIKVFSLIEQLDENLARQVCFLLAEVYLRMNFPRKTLSVIHFMETSLLSRGAKLKTTLPLEKEKDKEKDLDRDKEENKDKLGEDSPIPHGIKSRLQKLKIRACFACYSLDKAEKELSVLIDIEPDNPSTHCLKSHLELLKGNRHLALKSLNPLTQAKTESLKASGESYAVMYYNNLGCVHYASGKYHLACLNFQKALSRSFELFDEFPKITSGDPLSNRPIHTIGSNYKYELLYNLGTALLYGNKPSGAFDCLIEAAQFHHRDPLLWLRLAECCIQDHKPENQKDFRLSGRKRDIVQGSVGLGTHRKVVLSPRISNDDWESSENAAIPVPTLDFAALALRNAEHLLNKLISMKPYDDIEKEENDPKGKPNLTVTHSDVYTLSQLRKNSYYLYMKNAVLAASSYVALCLGDHLTSLCKAEQLLDQPNISGNHKLLGHLYAAESLVLLNRVSEAVTHLHPENVSQISNFPAEEKELPVNSTPNWYPSATQTAKAVLQYNLSAVYALRGEYEKAGDLLRQLWNAKGFGTDVPIQVVTLALFVELQLGHNDVARTIIKQHCPQYR